jgi:predicted short-subunit dehydrogenase-like oxidoreductase (DUF2520 family)
MNEKIKAITIIGAGNVAYHLARVFLSSGMKIVQVVARHPDSALRFASALPVTVVTPDRMLEGRTDLYILAVSDDGIEKAARELRTANRLVVHTSGTVPMDVLDGISVNTGVFYPLQTLSFGKDIDFSQVPLFIESNSKENTALLRELAAAVSHNVHIADSETRAMIHLAAVFASNFSYHMFTVASRILELEDIPPDILYPLILETARKAVQEPPGEAQTGPAARSDLEVLARHLGMLHDQELYARIYKLLSDSIIIHSKNKKYEL